MDRPEQLYCKSLNSILRQLLLEINEFYFFLTFNLLNLHSEIYMHLYNIISKNNFTYLNNTSPNNDIYIEHCFQNDRGWFEYGLLDEEKIDYRAQTQNKISLLCIFRHLLLDMNNHKHEYKTENAEFKHLIIFCYWTSYNIFK